MCDKSKCSLWVLSQIGLSLLLADEVVVDLAPGEASTCLRCARSAWNIGVTI